MLGRSLRIVHDNLDLLDAFFGRRRDVSWVRPRAGSVGYPRFTAADTDVDAIAARLVEEEGVLLLPGSQLGQAGTHFRIGFGREDLAEGLGRLQAFLDRQTG